LFFLILCLFFLSIMQPKPSPQLQQSPIPRSRLVSFQTHPIAFISLVLAFSLIISSYSRPYMEAVREFRRELTIDVNGSGSTMKRGPVESCDIDRNAEPALMRGPVKSYHNDDSSGPALLRQPVASHRTNDGSGSALMRGPVMSHNDIGREPDA